MKIALKIIAILVCVYTLCLLAFWFEEYYCKFIRFLYGYFTEGNLTFSQGKYFHFASGYFIAAFCAFWTNLYLTCRNRGWKSFIVRFSILQVVFLATTLLYSAVESKGFLGEASNEMIISPTEIKYDRIFIFSVVVSIVIGLLLIFKKRGATTLF